jgi:hypothetical protein
MMPYMTIIIYFELQWSYPHPDTRGRGWWANRLQQLHNHYMARGQEHALAIKHCKDEYHSHRGGGSNIA